MDYSASTDVEKMLMSLTPQRLPFKLRCRCALSLVGLNLLFKQSSRAKGVYPSPSEWCDANVRSLRSCYSIDKGIKVRLHSEKEISEEFICPAAPLGRCHYAMNPHCEPNSPPEMVLLFETKAGWNQHSGLELFTFDNHDPKGGCVLLNDRTVKFIRTEEELHQLRWK